MLQIGQLLINNERNHPDRLAVVAKERGLTYKELNEESNRIANGLKKLGARQEDRVAFLLKNSIEWIVAWFACQKIGVVCVPLHVRLRTKELTECIKTAGCNALIYHDDYDACAAELAAECSNLKIKVAIGDSGVADSISWESLYQGGDCSEAQDELENDDPAVLIFTSGTTGHPKGVLRSQEMVMLHAVALAIRNKSPHKVDVMLSTAPLYHIGGLQAMLKMLILGGTFVTFHSIEPAEILKMIEREKVTQLQMLPPITYERLYRSYCDLKTDTSSVWEVCISAGKCTMEYTEHIFEMFPHCHLRPSWGSTETCSVTCMQLTKEELREDPELIHAVGTVMPFSQVKVAGTDGKEKEPGEPGEAWVRSPMVFEGYVHNGSVCCCDEVFTEDGWFKTGDIIRIDPQTGYCYFLDRIKDVIKTGGESVFALEVERIIEKYPAVFECAAIGIPDERFGEAIGVAVVPAKGCTLDGRELQRFSMENMARFKKPRYMAVLDRMPVNSTGKISKADLREKYIHEFKAIT